MSWWFHPDRRGDFQDRMGLTKITGLEVTQSTDEGGVQVRLARWRDQRGWSHQHRTERQLGPDHHGQPSDGVFIVPSLEEVFCEHPTGQRMVLQCSGRIVFIPKSDGSTEVIVEHNHNLTGGRWLWRRGLRRSDQRDQSALLQKQIGLCEAALRAPK